jgi:hypothetical protein
MTRTVRLRMEAEIEAARLAQARALDGDGDGDREALAQLEAEGPWILVARRSGLRRRLAGRALLVWRVTCEDAAGRSVESRLVSVAIQLSMGMSGAPRTRAARAAFLRDLETAAGALVDAVVRDWREAAGEAARSFLAARVTREHAMAAAADHARRGPDEYQPGLFDRRAERAHGQAARAGADGRRDAADRAAVLARSMDLIVRPARLLLAVVP